MKHILYSILILGFVACSSSNEKENQLFGKWEYEKITKNDTSFIEISQGDEMELAVDYVFMYHVEKANKHEQGDWKLFGDTLQFTYQPEGKVRNFIIDKLDKETLVFHEGEVYFYYTKED